MSYRDETKVVEVLGEQKEPYYDDSDELSSTLDGGEGVWEDEESDTDDEKENGYEDEDEDMAATLHPQQESKEESKEESSSMKKGTVFRTKGLYSKYEFFLEDTEEFLFMAKKQPNNRTSNYHIWDMRRWHSGGSKLTKKSGNYVGKLRKKQGGYILYSRDIEKKELAALTFIQPSLEAQMQEGALPRQIRAMLCPQSPEGGQRPHSVPRPEQDSMLNGIIGSGVMEREAFDENFEVLESKYPTFSHGVYRLNFQGRVRFPSIKNFQLTTSTDRERVVCQFGKHDQDIFHLDYDEPVSPLQAFAFALAAFDL